MELISAFEVTLADPRADEAHPAFTNLFVRAAGSRRSRRWCSSAAAPGHRAGAAGWRTSWPRAMPQVPGCACRPTASAGSAATGPPNAPLAARLAAGAPAAARVAAADGGDGVPRHRPRPGVRAGRAAAHRARRQGAADLRHRGFRQRGTLRAVIDKYRQPSHVQRASLMSATLTGIRLRELRISADNFAAMQTLTTALALSLTRPQAAGAAPPARERPWPATGGCCGASASRATGR
jgi:cyclic beta-1,2-glucan synthetase